MSRFEAHKVPFLSQVCFAVAVMGLSLLSPDGAAAGGTRLDNTKTAAYKALARLTCESFENKDIETAASLGRVLARVWDQAEET